MNRLLLFVLTAFSLPVFSNSPVMEIIATEPPDTFAEQMAVEMKTNRSTDERRSAMEGYLNSLLKANAVYSTHQHGQKPSLFFQIRANKEGLLVITRNQQGEYGLQRGNRSLSVYGVNNQLESSCSWQEQLCWILYPTKTTRGKERWLEISYAPQAIHELSNGMSLLIRDMQK